MPRAGFFKGFLWGIFGSILALFLVWPRLDQETKNKLVKSSNRIKADVDNMIKDLKEK